MFNQLQNRLSNVVKSLRGQGKISEKNIKDAIRGVRRALLEADVNLMVVRSFIDKVQKKATGEKVFKSISPGQQFIKIIYDEMVSFLGSDNNEINYNGSGITVITMVGLQGVGKTTTARIIAKALNCKKQFVEGEKCKEGEFCHCKGIVNSNHLDVLEMDAASRTGIDDVRELIESSKYNPTSAKYKIIILDEVHMLSKQAFNGLLKTLEEPPPHLKFIFATTEVRKIPVTIISRCQRFDFRRVPNDAIVQRLAFIAKEEGCTISEESLGVIARQSRGGMRDAITMFEQVVALFGLTPTVEEVNNMLGIIEDDRTNELANALVSDDLVRALELSREVSDDGLDLTKFTKATINILRERLLVTARSKDVDLIGLSKLSRIIANLAAPKAGPRSLSWPTIISSFNAEDINSDQNSLLEPPPTKYISLLLLLTECTASKPSFIPKVIPSITA